MTDTATVLENLSEEEAYLFAILTDPSGLDQSEFIWVDYSSEDNKFCPHCETPRDSPHRHEHPEVQPGEWDLKYPAPSACFRAWAYQWDWWRSKEPLQVDCCARSVGKSLSIKARACAFPFVFPGQEMVITAPELVHLEPIVSLIESQLYSSRLLTEMVPRGKSAVTHRPFQANFVNGSRIIGRIPQRDGKGVKGCVEGSTTILTAKGFQPASEVKPGDKVLTHRGEWKDVVSVTEDVNDCYEVRGQGSYPLTVSCDHRFFGAENSATPKQKRTLMPLAWHDVEFLTEHQVYWATPTKFPQLPVPWPDVPFDSRSLSFWWLVGRYLADGFVSMDKKHNKARRVHWCVPPVKQPALFMTLDVLGLHSHAVQRDHSSADVIEVASASLYRWFSEHFGCRAGVKKLPVWALGMPAVFRQSILEGYLAGDGHWAESKKRWETGSASKVLSIGLQMLAQSLGYTVNCTFVQPKVTHIRGVELKEEPQVSWRLQIGHGHPVEMEGHLVAKVKSVTPVGKRPVYNIVVDEDHSYVTGSIVSHNIHPILLEQDESQDYPHAGWVELRETLKRGFEGATWRAHGVTRGVRDDFYQVTQDVPGNPWKVHRYAAMWRPNWTDTERQEALEKYGSADDPDYRRNILGLHGDKTNPIFVLTQLMRNVDNDPLSDYNANEYFKAAVKVEQLEMWGQEMPEVLDFPMRHLSYAGTPQERFAAPKCIYWAGMDIGFTIDPSEILVFVEYRQKPKDEQTVMRLLTRISMARMPHLQQLWAMLHVIDFYRPRAFSMDKTGLGLPLFQELQEYVEAFRAKDWEKVPGWMRAYDLETALTTVKGYNFSERLVVDLDQSVELSPYDDQAAVLSKAGMRRNAKEYACVDESTEVLTVDGWKHHEELTVGEPILTLDEETWLSEWQPIERISRYRVEEEELVSLEGRAHSSLTTPNHRWLIERYCPWRKAILREWRQSGALVRACAIPRVAPHNGCPMLQKVSDQFVELVGWFWTEGWYYQSGQRDAGACIAQSHRVHPGNVDRIEAVIRAVYGVPGPAVEGFAWHRYVKDGMTRWVIHRSAAVDLVDAVSFPSKSLEPRFLLGLTAAQLRLLVDVSLMADGAEQTETRFASTWTRRSIGQEDEGRIRSFEMLCALAGIPTSTSAFGGKWHCHLAVPSRSYPLMANGRRHAGKTTQRYTGTIWCPTTENGTWLARRNGSVYYTGNTDILREMVDRQQLWLPWDEDLLKQFQGGTWSSAAKIDAYGRRVFSRGNDHVLDAARMFALGWAQHSIEEMMKTQPVEPVLDMFVPL